jgi:hypothetical protein
MNAEMGELSLYLSTQPKERQDEFVKNFTSSRHCSEFVTTVKRRTLRLRQGPASGQRLVLTCRLPAAGLLNIAMKTLPRFFSFAAIGLLAAGSAIAQLAEEYRMWTNTSGKQVEATLVSVDAASKTLKIKMKDGREFDVAIATLSPADFEYAKARYAAMQAAPAPATPAPAAVPAAAAKAPANPRPLRLLGWPEPIDVTAELPDAPPLLFRWRRQVHHVAAADGPERIASEWWHAPKNVETRDYYRLEDRQGRRFWVYREGLWTQTRDRPPRWFLHGLFA